MAKLLVALAFVGLALAPSSVLAHGSVGHPLRAVHVRPYYGPCIEGWRWFRPGYWYLPGQPRPAVDPWRIRCGDD